MLQQKKLDCLDDPLQKYFPGFSVKNPFNSDAITIRYANSISLSLAMRPGLMQYEPAQVEEN